MMAVVDVAALSAQVSDKTIWTFVRLTTETGRVGWGEATLQDSASAVHAQVRAMAPAIIGGALPWPINSMELFGVSGDDLAMATAASAIDQALWDLMAQE